MNFNLFIFIYIIFLKHLELSVFILNVLYFLIDQQKITLVFFLFIIYYVLFVYIFIYLYYTSKNI